MKKIIGIVLIAIAFGIVLIVLYINSGVENQTRIFSSYSLLTSSWEKYKTQFINKDGRVVDTTQNNVTTSEGQSYALLRAVWVDDKTTFDFVWNWTKNNLKRKNDNLFGWRWGQIQGNNYGFLANGGDNTASDADCDIALALVLASMRWNNTNYLDQAKPIIDDIWNIDTATASANKRYLIAGNWAVTQQNIIVNVSYFAPYSWRIFSIIDKKHDWLALLQPSYDLLNAVGENPLDKSYAVGLPPNWIEIDRTSGKIFAPTLRDLTTDYSYDAMRTPWRIALDYQWNKDPRDLHYLQKSFQKLKNDYDSSKTLAGSYSHNGTRLTNIESPSMYATSLGYFLNEDEQIASQIYQNKIIKLYSNDQLNFNKNIPYYEQNWLWFGAALYNNYLSNFQ